MIHMPLKMDQSAFHGNIKMIFGKMWEGSILPSSQPKVRARYPRVDNRMITKTMAIVSVAARASLIRCSLLKSGLAKLDVTPGGGGPIGTVGGILFGSGNDMTEDSDAELRNVDDGAGCKWMRQLLG